MTINIFLKKERVFLLSSFLVLLVSLVGCQKEPNLNFGSTYVGDNGSANIVRVDTTTVLMSTVYTDSTNTVGTGYLMVGNINDPYFGNVNTRAFFQVTPPSPLPKVTVYDGYDSIGMILIFKKNNPYYGDTTYYQTFNINQVDTLYQLPSYVRNYSSKSQFPIDPTPLGSTSVQILPSVPFSSQFAGDSIRIRMDDGLGRQLYNMVFNNSDTLTQPAAWLQWFHGLCLSSPTVPAGIPGNLFGFRDSAIMRIYYHQPGATSTPAYIDFNITNRTSTQFNNIVVNRQGSPMQNLVTPGVSPQIPPLTPSTTAGFKNAGYLYSLLGLDVKLTFPYLNNIALRPDYIGLLRAELTVNPVPGSWTTTWRVPPQVEVSYTDLNNLVDAPIPGPTGIQYGNLVLQYQTPTQATYTYDITPFIKTQIIATGVTSPQNGVILSLPTPTASTGNNSASTANPYFLRAVLADQSYPVNQRTYLSVYYIGLYPHQ